MDGADGSQTYQYMHGIDHGRGLRDNAAELRKPRWLSDKGQECMCVCVNVDGLDHMRCKYNSGGIYMPNKCKKRNHFVDSGPKVYVRCSKPKRQLYAKNTK